MRFGSLDYVEPEPPPAPECCGGGGPGDPGDDTDDDEPPECDPDDEICEPECDPDEDIGCDEPPDCDEDPFAEGCEVCGDERDVMAQEYEDFSVNWTPECEVFASSGGTSNFTWSELNGGWANGNPHAQWGYASPSLTQGLEATRANYNRGGILLSSGYRCPHGNSAVGSVAPQTSWHMHGRAADMFSDDHPWTEVEFETLRTAALSTGTVELLQWESYADHHLHATW